MRLPAALLRALQLALALAFASWAISPAEARNHIAAELVAESTMPAPGSSVAIAIRYRPEPGWHGYWINPGDAGRPGQYRWSLPNGVIVGALRYPVPQRLVVQGLMNHVYTGEHALLAPLSLARNIAPGTRLPLRLRAVWLACTDQICVPENGDLALDLTAGDGAIAPSAQNEFDRWRVKLPQPLGGQATFNNQGDSIKLAVPWPGTMGGGNPWFFAQTEGAVAYGAAQQAEQQGDTLILTLKHDPYAAGPPQSLSGLVALADGRGFTIDAVPGLPAPVARTGLMATLFALGGAILGGLLLNLMPCVFPVISLKALSLARAGGSEHAVGREAIGYCAGVVSTCVALGAALLALRAGGHQIGWAFQLQNPAVITLLLLLVGAITCNLAGLFELKGLSHGGTRGAFSSGALAAFVATPCTGPFMAAALGAALVLPWPAALAIFAGLGLGMALPFLALGFVPALRRRIPQPGAWMVRFQRILAVPMGLTALALGWLLWRQAGGIGLAFGLGALALLGIGLFALRRRPVPVAGLALALVVGALSMALVPGTAALHPAATADGAVTFSPARLTQLRQGGHPVFLYFTADWCLTCKVNEQVAIGRSGTSAHFRERGITVMAGDWTRNDPAITRFLESQGRSGVPLYLYYPAGGGAPVVLPQVLTQATLTAL